MSDLHQVVVDDIGKVVCRKPVRLDENEIALVLVLLVKPVNGVRERRAALAAEPDDMAFATRSSTCGLVRRYAATGAGVVDQVAAVEGLLLVPLKVLRGAETPISMAALEKLLRVMGVVVQTLGLSEVSTTPSCGATKKHTWVYGPYGPPTSGPSSQSNSAHFRSLMSLGRASSTMRVYGV